MPQRKSAGNLHDVCLGFITKNITYWTEHYEEYYLGQGTYRYVLGPFNQLNSQLSEDLLTILVKQQQLSRAALHLLLYGGALRTLDLSSCSRIVSDEIIATLATSCKLLQTLDLSYCKRVTSTGFITMARNLPHLSSLNVTKTNLRGIAAQTIFKECFGLQDLCLKHCQVSDEDLVVLCQVALGERGTKLKRLNLLYTLVTERGICTILRSIPQLQVVEYATLLSCLFVEANKGHNHDFTLKDSNSYKLRSLQCPDFIRVSNEMLQAIPFLCPLLTHLDLRFAHGFDDTGLRCMSQLQHLKDLQLCGEESEDITFKDGVMPVLRAIGLNLTVLSLQDISGLDPVAVYQLCPNLRKLFVLMMNDSKMFGTVEGSTNANNCPVMTRLTELDFWCRNGDISLSDTTLCLVLSRSIALESLGLIRLDTFTDMTIQYVLQNNNFIELKQLSLHECHNVTYETLSDLLLSSSNKLKFVKLINCLQVSCRDCELLRQNAKIEYYDLNIEWQ